MIHQAELIREHAELDDLACRLIAVMTARDFCSPDLPVMRARLSHLLAEHLEKEDGHVYPALIGSPKPRARWIATRFSAEMGGLARSYAAYVRRWTDTQVTIDPEGFRSETIAVMQALRARIAREDAELYPMLDLTIDSGSPAVARRRLSHASRVAPAPAPD